MSSPAVTLNKPAISTQAQLLLERDKALRSRFAYLYKRERLRMDDVLEILTKEFFITERTIRGVLKATPPTPVSTSSRPPTGRPPTGRQHPTAAAYGEAEFTAWEQQHGQFFTLLAGGRKAYLHPAVPWKLQEAIERYKSDRARLFLYLLHSCWLGGDVALKIEDKNGRKSKLFAGVISSMEGLLPAMKQAAGLVDEAPEVTAPLP